MHLQDNPNSVYNRKTDHHVFKPAAAAPTREKIQKNIYVIIAVITIVGIAALYSRTTHLGLGIFYLVWVFLCSMVIYLYSRNVYIIEITIDPKIGILHFSFMNYKGKIGHKKIDIKQAKYSYKPAGSNHNIYVLTIHDKDTKLKIRETKAESEDSTNVFFRNQMDQMNQIILQVKGDTGGSPIAGKKAV